MKKIKKQFLSFLIIGGIQYLLDAFVFSILILSISIASSNILSRMAGAIVGYLLNGMITFRRTSGVKINYPSLFKFILVWGFMTLLSTLIITWIASDYSLNWHTAVLVKITVEMTLIIISFSLQNYFVYR